jgi:acetyl esterase/lipase
MSEFKYLFVIVFTLLFLKMFAQEKGYAIKEDIQYYPKSVTDTNDYIKERCLVDVYYPTKKKGFATVVWIHGGGLHGGYKQMPGELRNQGLAIVGISYRLHPIVKSPVYIEDAAVAVAWVFNHIEEFGGDSSKIFISGHSAGGYLTSMVGLDKSYLAKHNIDANRIAGLIPLSGHTITHFTVRKEQGIPGTQPTVDSLAPLFHVRKDCPPLVLITGDREMELFGRYEENAYMYRMMKVVGHTETYLHEISGLDHGMVHTAMPMVMEYIEKIVEQKEIENTHVHR